MLKVYIREKTVSSRMVLGESELDIYMYKNETRSLSLTVYINQFKKKGRQKDREMIRTEKDIQYISGYTQHNGILSNF